MAEGRKIPYWIELAVDDRKIKQQMAKLDWENIMGSHGKGFGDILISDTDDAKEKIKKILGGLNVDWSKILGEKEIGQLEQAVTKALSKSRREIELFATSGDTTGIEKTIEYVSALGDELKGLGSSFDAASLARGMGAFMKVLMPLTAKFEVLADEPKKVEAAFDRLFTGIATSAKSVDLGKTFDVSGKIKIAMQGLKATNDEIREATESLDKYRNMVAKLSGDNPATIKLAQDAAGLNQQLDEQMRKEEQLAAQNKTNSAQYAATLKNIMAIENARLKLKEKPTTDYTGMEIREDFGYYEEQINKVVERISKKMEEVEGKLANTVDKSFAEIISKQISDIKLSVSLSEQAEKQFVNEINAFVKKVNQSPIEGVKIQIDDAANIIEDKQKRAYGQNEGDDDANTTKIVEQTEKRLDRIAASIKGKQDQIVEQTKNWRKQMLEQFKFKSGDFEFKFNDNLIEELQTLFDEYGLKVNIDPIYLADQIKTVLEGSSVSFGGGTTNVDPSTMASAVMAGVRAALVGEPLTIHTPVNSAQEKIPDATEQVATEIEQTAKHLDVAEEYVQDVVKKIKDVAKYATKHIGTEKDSTGAKATREFFNLIGGAVKDENGNVVKNENKKPIPILDLTVISQTEDDAVVAKMLEQAFLKEGEHSKLIGNTAIDELSKFKGSSSKTIPAFVASLAELFYMLQEDTETVEEWKRKKDSKEVFDWARGRAKAADALREVRSPIRQEKIPSAEAIDKTIMLMTAIGRNTDSLEVLKEAREKLGSQTDDASVKEFQDVASEFYKDSTRVFYDLKKQAEDMFKGTIYMQGSKKGVIKRQDIDSYKQLAKIDDGAVLLDIRVTSSMNNVALGEVGSKYGNRPSLREEQRLMRGQGADYLVSKEYEEDILNREVGYQGFKPQGTSEVDVNFDANLEANQKQRKALLKEIELKEQEKEILQKQIATQDKYIEQLSAKNKTISQSRKNAAQEKVSSLEKTETQLTSDIFWFEQQVGNDKDGDERIVGKLTLEIEEQLRRRAFAERQLAELSEVDVERKKKSLTNKIAEIESEDIPKLQEQLTKAQERYAIASSDKFSAQAEVFKAQSALKSIPNTKANEKPRAEATEQVTKARWKLESATKKFEDASKDIDDITKGIERSKQQVETLRGQVSETTLETVRQEQINRIQAINNVITSLETEFASTLSKKREAESALDKTGKELKRARDVVPLRVPRELEEATSRRDALLAQTQSADAQIQASRSEIDRIERLDKRLNAEKEYNGLLEKSLMLQGSIKKMTEDGATEEALSKKRSELGKINSDLAEALEKVKSLGGFIAQQETKEYSDADRKTYALSQLALIEDNLITAKAQRSVVAARISKKDKEIAEVDSWGLGVGIGERELGKEKGRLTSEFMSSDYVRELQEALREKTKAAIAEAEQKSREIFDKKVYEAMLKEGMNPYDQEQTRQFLETGRGKQYSSDFASEVDFNTKYIWSQYDERIKAIRDRVLAEFKESMQVRDGVLSYTSKTKDETGEWVDEIVEVAVRDALRERLVAEKEILEEKQVPIGDVVSRLETDKKAAIEYGGIGDKEILSPEIIQDQIRKQTKLDELLDERIDKEKALKDLEMAGVQDSDDSVKQAKKGIERLDKDIARYEMLIRNRKKLVDMRYEESREPTYTDEEKELHFTNQIVGCNQKIEDSLAKQEELRQKIATASEEEKARLEYALKQEEDKVAGWRGKVSKFEGKLQGIGTAKSEAATTRTGETTGGLLGFIKEAIGDVDLTKVEDILSKILAILSGNGVVGSTRSSEMDAKLERIKELEAKQQLANEQKKTAETATQVENAKKETAVTTNVANSKAHKNVSKTRIYKDIQKSVDTFRTSELKADKEPLNAIKLALNELSKINDQNSQEYIEWQRKLGSALAAYGKKNGIENGKGYYDKVYAELEKNGVTIDPKLAITNTSGISNALVEKGLVTIKEKEAKAKQSEAKAEEKITEEKIAQERIRFTRKEKKELNRLKSETKDYNPNTTTSTTSKFGGFATENTLRAILEVIGKISTNGVPKSGAKASGTGTRQDDSEQDNSETTELERRVGALKNKFKDAISVGYLDDNNADLVAFNKQLEDIANSNDTVDQLEEMRKKALALGDVVSKTVSKNKRMYSGTTEINAATRQRDNMRARDILDYADLKMVENYNTEYNALIDKHKEFAIAGTLYDPNNQKTLQNMAIKVKDLGKQLEKSATEAEQLQKLVNDSGTYNGQNLGSREEVGLIDSNSFEALAKKRLQELGAEHIRFDKIHKVAIGTKRLDNRTVAELEVKYNDLTEAMYTYQKAEKESLTGLPAFLNGFQKKINSIMQYLSMTMSIHQVTAELRKGIQYVREIDLALTELKKVTDETEAEYDQFLQTAAKTGARLGTTISAVTEATATFAKLGYSMEQATEMAESAIVYKNVGDNIASTEDAADSIISTMKGFGLEASESMAIVDRFNEVGE